MNGVFDTYLESNRFAANASKCNTDEERIKFCKAFLEKKGIKIEEKKTLYDPPWSSLKAPSTKVIFGQAEEVQTNRSIDHFYLEQLSVNQKIDCLAHYKVDMANEIGTILAKADFIKFHEMTDYSTQQYRIKAIVKVMK